MGCPSLTNLSTSRVVEHFSYYTFSAAVLILRGCVRLRTRGWKGFQVDDYIAIWVLICVVFAGFFTINSLRLGGTWLFIGAKEEVNTLRKCQVDTIRIGSIYNVLNWYMYTGLIWGLKAMMLVFLNRLYCGLARCMIRAVAIICVVSFLVCYIVVTFSCYPIQKNWQVQPLPHNRCMRRTINIYTVSGLNAATDFCILLIPLRLLRTIQVSFWQKMLLGLLLCSGVLIMTTALLRVGFLHTSNKVGQISNWGSREVLVATVVVNMPIIAPIMKKGFWRRGYGSQVPHRSTSLNLGGLDVTRGTHDGSFGRRRPSEAYDLSSPGTPDTDYTASQDLMSTISTMSTRNDSAAATMLKTEFHGRAAIPEHREELELEDTPSPRRRSFDRDLESGRVDERMAPPTDRRGAVDLPSSPEPAHFWPRCSTEQASNQRQNGWLAIRLPEG